MKSWLSSFENGLYYFAEFIQTNPGWNYVMFIVGFFLKGLPSILSAALSFWAFMVNKIDEYGGEY